MTIVTDRKYQTALEYRYFRDYNEVVGQINVGEVPNASSPLTWINFTDGYPNPFYRTQILRGENATTSFRKRIRECFRLNTRAEVQYFDSQGRMYYRGWTGHPQLIEWSLAEPWNFDATKADRLARQEFLKKYRQRRTAFQGGVFIGEMKELVAMIRRPAKALRDGIDRYHGAVKERLRRAKHKRRTIQDTWLEYSFGWTPFINDIKDACKLATATSNRAFERITADVIDYIENDRTRESVNFTPLEVFYTRHHLGYVKVEYSGAVACTNNAPGFPEQLGLSWSNVLPTAWELIPYSFLVDYFTNIGNVVDGISTGQINLAWGYQGIRRTREVTVGNSEPNMSMFKANIPPGGTGSIYANLAGKLESFTYYERVPIVAISVGIRDFSWEFPTKAKQWLNIAALAPMQYLRTDPDQVLEP